MLKITEPLPVVLRVDFLQSNESFPNRIAENYRAMQEWVTPEDMLHVVTQPPEIFLMGEGGSMLFNETNVRNEQRQKVEIINNVVNRILLAADGHISYQDEVYITNVLHKLGIKDERTFMRQVYALTDETKQTNRLLHAYLSNRQQLVELVNNYKKSVDAREEHTEEHIAEEVLHLHEDVFRRWMAGSVYKTLQNFSFHAGHATDITKETYRIAEQSRLAQQLLLQQLREEIRGESVPLVYRHENIYEGDDTTTQEITEQSVTNRLSAAVLLSMIDNVYQSTYSRVDHGKDTVYYTTNTFYQAGDATFERILNNTEYRQALYEDTESYEFHSSYTDAEFETVQQIIRAQRSGDITAFTVEEGDEISVEETDIVMPEEQVTNISTRVDERNSLEQKLYQTNRINMERQQQFIQNLANIANRYEQERPRRTSSEARREQLLALEEPEAFARLAEERSREMQERRQEFAAATMELYPQSTREVFALIEEYLRAPEAYSRNMVVMRTPEALLYYDSRSERIESAEEILEKERRMERSIQMTDRILERLPGEYIVEEAIPRDAVQYSYRTEGVNLSDETVSEIRNQVRRNEQRTTQLSEEVKNIAETTERQINTITNEVVNISDTRAVMEETEAQIEPQQISEIAEKVYSRIERQLSSERRRRGL